MCRPGWSVVLIAGYAEVMLQASLSLCGCSCLPCCEFCSCSIGSFACAWSSAGRVSAPASGACPAKGVAYGATAAQMTGECGHVRALLPVYLELELGGERRVILESF